MRGEGARKRAENRKKREAYHAAGGRWMNPVKCETCGDWGTVSNPDPYGSRLPCPDCGQQR